MLCPFRVNCGLGRAAVRMGGASVLRDTDGVERMSDFELIVSGSRRAPGAVFCRLLAIAAGCVLLLTATAHAQVLDAVFRETVERVPSAGLFEPELEVTHFRPEGEGPFPVVLINHGRARGDAKLQGRYRPMVAAREFVNRGYAVVAPMRQGFGNSGGAEIRVGCNVHSNGLQQARSVGRALDWVSRQPWADVSRTVVIGQSHGGLATLAYGTQAREGVKLLVNFAGGLRQAGCSAWEDTLIRAIGDYARQTRVASLWFYGDNDSYFSPFVWRSAFERYRENGGPATLVAFGSFGSDAHALFGSRAGLAIWLPVVMAAFDRAGLPTGVLPEAQARQDLAPPSASGFAEVHEIDRVPVRSERAREGYREWLNAGAPKAFAIHPTQGGWGSSWGGERPYARALASCERHAKSPCRLYAVDDRVVWVND